MLGIVQVDESAFPPEIHCQMVETPRHIGFVEVNTVSVSCPLFWPGDKEVSFDEGQMYSTLLVRLFGQFVDLDKFDIKVNGGIGQLHHRVMPNDKVRIKYAPLSMVNITYASDTQLSLEIHDIPIHIFSGDKDDVIPTDDVEDGHLCIFRNDGLCAADINYDSEGTSYFTGSTTEVCY